VIGEGLERRKRREGKGEKGNLGREDGGKGV